MYDHKTLLIHVLTNGMTPRIMNNWIRLRSWTTLTRSCQQEEEKTRKYSHRYHFFFQIIIIVGFVTNV